MIPVKLHRLAWIVVLSLEICSVDYLDESGSEKALEGIVD
jgi:hypothetical protein